MWSYEKRLQFPIRIQTPNAAAAKVIISQYGGPDGELGASMRYLSQRYTMKDRRVAGLLTDNVLVMADTIVQEVIRPLLTPVFSVVLFFLCFAALRMVISLLVTVLGLVNRLPVLGAVNRGLGLAAGVAAGLADVFLLLCVVWALIVITGGNLPALNEQLLGGSIYYQTFSRINPFL